MKGTRNARSTRSMTAMVMPLRRRAPAEQTLKKNGLLNKAVSSLSIVSVIHFYGTEEPPESQESGSISTRRWRSALAASAVRLYPPSRRETILPPQTSDAQDRK